MFSSHLILTLRCLSSDSAALTSNNLINLCMLCMKIPIEFVFFMTVTWQIGSNITYLSDISILIWAGWRNEIMIGGLSNIFHLLYVISIFWVKKLPEWLLFLFKEKLYIIRHIIWVLLLTHTTNKSFLGSGSWTRVLTALPRVKQPFCSKPAHCMCCSSD